VKQFNVLPCSLAVYVACILLLSACKKDSSPIEDNSKNSAPAFIFSLSVKNNSDTPVSGLQISLFANPVGSFLQKENGRRQILSSATTVGFAIEQSCHVDFSIRELDGSVVSRSIDTSLQLGMYSLFLSFPDGGAGTRVFKGMLIATSETAGKELYRDSIYLTLWRVDAAASVVGVTTSAGVFETANALMFPGIMALPLMTKTAVTGPDSIGTFSIPKDIVITLRDTVNHRQQEFVKTLTAGENRFDLVWNPVLPGKIQQRILRFPSTSGTIRPVSPPPNVAWRLRQNYPNPFD
jgi:hypothetical protein